MYDDIEDYDFSFEFGNVLAASCKHFVSNRTCSKKPKNYLGLFSQPCSMLDGGTCDAHKIDENIPDLQWSFDFAKCMQDEHEKNKSKEIDV